MNVMLYPCMLCVTLLMCLFVFCVACLTVFVNCLVKQFTMSLGVVAILLLNVMDVFSVCDVWSSKECVCCDPNERLSAPSICLLLVLFVFLYVGSYLLILEFENWITGV